MSLRNTKERYGSIAQMLHWLIALLVIGLLAVGLFMTSSAAPQAFKGTLYFYHKSFGLTVLFFMVFRVLWRMLSIAPELPSSIPAWERFAARVVQGLLYLLLFAIPITGWLMSVWSKRYPDVFGLFEARLPLVKNMELAKLMNTWHEYFAWIIIVLLVLHIGAAFKHHFIAKNAVLRQMLPRHFK